jgi:hypothetical protein
VPPCPVRNKFKKIFKKLPIQAPVTHAYNPSYMIKIKIKVKIRKIMVPGQLGRKKFLRPHFNNKKLSTVAPACSQQEA